MKIAREIAEQLVETLKNHSGIIPGIIPVNEMKFIGLLTSITIDSTSKKFYIEIPNDKYQPPYQQPGESTKRYHLLSIRRVLINKNAVYNVSLIKKIWGNLISKIRWSSNVFSRSLRLNPKIVEFLTENKSQFSLLVKFQTYDYNNKDEVLFVRSQPILALPNAKEDEIKTIEEWEKKNTFYEKSTPFLGYQKRISFEKYSAKV